MDAVVKTACRQRRVGPSRSRATCPSPSQWRRRHFFNMHFFDTLGPRHAGRAGVRHGPVALGPRPAVISPRRRGLPATGADGASLNGEWIQRRPNIRARRCAGNRRSAARRAHRRVHTFSGTIRHRLSTTKESAVCSMLTRQPSSARTRAMHFGILSRQQRLLEVDDAFHPDHAQCRRSD